MEKYNNKRRYNITNHFRQRFSERVLGKNYLGRLHFDDEKNMLNIIYKESTEEKSWVNNLNIVHYLKTKYPKQKIIILQYKEFWIICTKDLLIDNHYILVTIYNKNNNFWSTSCYKKINKIIDIKCQTKA